MIVLASQRIPPWNIHHSDFSFKEKNKVYACKIDYCYNLKFTCNSIQLLELWQPND